MQLILVFMRAVLAGIGTTLGLRLGKLLYRLLRPVLETWLRPAPDGLAEQGAT